MPRPVCHKCVRPEPDAGYLIRCLHCTKALLPRLRDRAGLGTGDMRNSLPEFLGGRLPVRVRTLKRGGGASDSPPQRRSKGYC
jgi:hypothetical protein